MPDSRVKAVRIHDAVNAHGETTGNGAVQQGDGTSTRVASSGDDIAGYIRGDEAHWLMALGLYPVVELEARVIMLLSRAAGRRIVIYM